MEINSRQLSLLAWRRSLIFFQTLIVWKQSQDHIYNFDLDHLWKHVNQEKVRPIRVQYLFTLRPTNVQVLMWIRQIVRFPRVLGNFCRFWRTMKWKSLNLSKQWYEIVAYLDYFFERLNSDWSWNSIWNKSIKRKSYKSAASDIIRRNRSYFCFLLHSKRNFEVRRDHHWNT